MNRYPSVLLCLSLLAAAGCDQLQTPREPATVAEDPAPQGLVLARVNGTPITQPVFEVYAAQRQSQQHHGSDSSKETILDELVSLYDRLFELIYRFVKLDMSGPIPRAQKALCILQPAYDFCVEPLVVSLTDTRCPSGFDALVSL